MCLNVYDIYFNVHDAFIFHLHITKTAKLFEWILVCFHVTWCLSFLHKCLFYLGILRHGKVQGKLRHGSLYLSCQYLELKCFKLELIWLRFRSSILVDKCLKLRIIIVGNGWDSVKYLYTTLFISSLYFPFSLLDRQCCKWIVQQVLDWFRKMWTTWVISYLVTLVELDFFVRQNNQLHEFLV